MAYLLTVNAPTKLWTLDAGTGYVSYPSVSNAAPGGPYEVVPTTVPFDPVHRTGGTFWFLIDGPDAGAMISSSTNSLGYGDISIEYPDDPSGTPVFGTPQINPLADWRLLIKGMGGAGPGGKHRLTFNADTMIWSRTTGGIISWPSTVTASAGGPYWVNPIVVPFDPVHETGGSFWELKEGPNIGFLVSFHSNELAYGDITVEDGDFDRGPGEVLATFHSREFPLANLAEGPNSHATGASQNYNAPGEMHFTLLVDDPRILVPQPKRTHYSIEFEQTPGEEDWIEVFAGMIWDFEATETDVIFYGIDYLALLQYSLDERFDVDTPDEPPPAGSKYVTSAISDIISDQLTYAIGQLDSVIGFLTVGDIATMGTTTTIYSTFQNTMAFVVGLLDSWRAGSGKMTRITVEPNGSGGYEIVIRDNPGVNRDELLIQYGQLAQGYKARPFGVDWASRVNMIGRTLNGTRVAYQSIPSSVDQATWGRISGPVQYVDVVDEDDMARRALQAAIDASRIGRQVGVGTRLGSFRPFEGYNLCDNIPVSIRHGAVMTDEWSNSTFGSDPADDPASVMEAYWSIIGVIWEADNEHWTTTPILWPRGSGSLDAGPPPPAANCLIDGEDPITATWVDPWAYTWWMTTLIPLDPDVPIEGVVAGTNDYSSGSPAVGCTVGDLVVLQVVTKNYPITLDGTDWVELPGSNQGFGTEGDNAAMRTTTVLRILDGTAADNYPTFTVDDGGSIVWGTADAFRGVDGGAIRDYAAGFSATPANVIPMPATWDTNVPGDLLIGSINVPGGPEDDPNGILSGGGSCIFTIGGAEAGFAGGGYTQLFLRFQGQVIA